MTAKATSVDRWTCRRCDKPQAATIGSDNYPQTKTAPGGLVMVYLECGHVASRYRDMVIER